jgi:hypothetical protein
MCLAVEKQSIKIVANKIGNKQKCALSKTTNELIDTNDHGDEQNVNYEETHLKEYHILGSSPRVASVILSFCNDLSA